MKISRFVFVYMVFITSASFASGRTLEISHVLKENITKAFLYESSILDAFWTGDDGVECGEPKIELLSIDYGESKIIFHVIPTGEAQGCEVRDMVCEVPFTETKDQTISIPNSSVYLYEGCSSL